MIERILLMVVILQTVCAIGGQLPCDPGIVQGSLPAFSRPDAQSMRVHPDPLACASATSPVMISTTRSASATRSASPIDAEYARRVFAEATFQSKLDSVIASYTTVLSNVLYKRRHGRYLDSEQTVASLAMGILGQMLTLSQVDRIHPVPTETTLQLTSADRKIVSEFFTVFDMQVIEEVTAKIINVEGSLRDDINRLLIRLRTTGSLFHAR